MKFYPILSNSQNYWRNWTNTHLREMNSKIISLFDYVYYFNPDFYEYNLTVTNNTVYLADLPYHGYYRVSSAVTDLTTNKTLSPGTLIVSYARGEGQIDNSSAIIRNQKENYTIQPFGWAAYYYSSFANAQLTFTYDRRAEETYGLNYVFAFETTAKRFYVKDAVKNAFLAQINTYQPASVTIAAHSGDISNVNEWQVVSQKNNNIVSVWTNITSNPLMHEFYYKSNTNYNYDRIIFDHKRETSSKVATTNIAIYTIIKKESSTWPLVDNLWFEAW